MEMHPHHYKNMIIAAVERGDGGLLDVIAARLQESTEVACILRARGYGQSGTSLLQMLKNALPPEPK